MTTKRKLEEKIAESKDPVIRKQLRELLDARNRRSRQRIDKGIDKAKKVFNYIDDTLGYVDVDAMTPEEKKEYEESWKTCWRRVIGVLIAFGLVFLIFVIWIAF